MLEILGKNLKKFFDIIDNPPNDAEITYAGNRYEVWGVTDELFKRMCNMSDEEFVELAGEGAWWRQSDGSNLGQPNAIILVNGKELKCWTKEDNFYGTCWCYGEEALKKEYESLSEYLCDEVGASLPRNVCACAMDLAKYNDMTMSELFEKFEG